MADSRKHLLLVEDEAPLREALAERLAEHGFEVEQADTGERAIEQLAEFAFDIVITDLRLPGLDGTRVLEAALVRYPDIVGIIVTGVRNREGRCRGDQARRDRLRHQAVSIRRAAPRAEFALEQRRLKSENAYLRSQLQERYKFEGIIGRSPAMRNLLACWRPYPARRARFSSPVKRAAAKKSARAIHHNSPRRAQRFVALNCGAIPRRCSRQSCSSRARRVYRAIGTRQGRLEQAHKGTLFLDEVGTMSAALQMKLLRVLQEREFERLGDTHTIKVDVRVIAATNSDLKKMVGQGEFREDLFYRLNVIPIELPPLRDRKEDIPLLVQHFLKKFAEQAHGSGRPEHAEGRPLSISQQAMRALMAYSWPGNVRQLENAIERAVALSGGRQQIETADLTSEIQQASESQASPDLTLPDDGIDFEHYVSRIERELIRRALEKTGGNKGQASRLLNLKRTTLVEKLKRLEPRN
jgi:DNA-binding NtrC family response regulator